MRILIDSDVLLEIALVLELHVDDRVTVLKWVQEPRPHDRCGSGTRSNFK